MTRITVLPSAAGIGVGTRDDLSFAAQWLACTLPYRRFAATLADDCARLGVDVTRYVFIVVDSHHLLSAGLPAHSRKSPATTWSSTSQGAGAAWWADAFTLAAGVLPAQDQAELPDSVTENQ